VDRLKDKVAIVTGGANGIGKAICELFSAEGAWVLVVDIEQSTGESVVESIRSRGGGVQFCRADVSKQEEVQNAVDIAASRSGKIDVLCNNAAYLSPDFHAALESTEEEWRRCIDIALMGTHYFTKSVLPYMLAQKQGSIVNIVSIQAMQGMMTSVAYTATKAAMLGYTMSISYDYGPQNIRVNSLCPGPIQTRISVGADDPHRQWQCDQTTFGRVGQPSEVAWAALFLQTNRRM
jgi:NAD(P)-dependent dehydrogenase (short-subunit alcohol dehydrogenase family)